MIIKNDKILEEYNETSMRLLKNFLNCESMVLKTLEICGIKYGEFYAIEKQYSIDDEIRAGVMVKTQNPDSNDIENTIIDFINAEELYYKQLVEVSRGIGENCKNRILMFTDEEGIPLPEKYSFIMDDFIDYLNKFGLNIYQVCADVHFFPELSSLNLLRKPCKKPEFDVSELPDLKRFREAEYWQFYYYPDSIFFPLYEHEKVGDYLFDTGHWHECPPFESYFNWDGDGAYMKFSDPDKSGVLEENLDRIKIQCKYSKFGILKNEKGESDLLIDIHDGSLEDFFHLTPQQKIYLADQLSAKVSEFRCFFEDMSLDRRAELIDR